MGIGLPASHGIRIHLRVGRRRPPPPADSGIRMVMATDGSATETASLGVSNDLLLPADKFTNSICQRCLNVVVFRTGRVVASTIS